MMGRSSVPVALLLGLFAFAAPPGARAATDDHAAVLCAGLANAVEAAAPGSGPVFVASYRPADDETALPPPLATAAFTYDNALAAIALVACGDTVRARRIGDALLAAVGRDRTFADGRVRNAYRAGAVGPGPVLLPGFWDAGARRWAEDAYQDGSATGNVAWAALALLTLHAATGGADDLAAARRLMAWIVDHTQTTGGYRGGTFGFDPNQSAIAWMSTEHNIDVAAVAAWLYRVGGAAADKAVFDRARGFVERAFAAPAGRFLIGTTPSGALSDAAIVLDVQLWPWMAIADAPAEWRRALAFAESRLAVAGGFDFDGDRDGVWVEGTAQAALAYRLAGEPARGRALVGGLMADRSSSGLLYATRKARLTTGLAVAPEGAEPDFFYFPRPHLGATAWAALAALGWNPFTGRRTE
jgi:hypothetical protein